MCDDSESFYAAVPVFRGFGSLMDPALYQPLPDDWTIGTADIVQSTKAIAENRYKAVNMAGASVIASVTNALGGREFPFVFGGDGASFAVAPHDLVAARDALAATAAWVNGELGLTMRVALIPVAHIRAQGLDVRVARFAPSPNVSYAMFSGGGLAWADAAMKRGEFAVDAGTARNLARSHRAVVPVRGNPVEARPDRLDADHPGARRRSGRLPRADRKHRHAHRPESERRRPGPVRRCRRCAGRRRASRSKSAPSRAIDGCADIGAGFDPALLPHHAHRRSRRRLRAAKYLRQVVENSDFRKYDDGLRMILDCTPALADQLEIPSQGRVRHRALRPASSGRRDDDLLYAVTDAQRSRPFRRRRPRRLRFSRDGTEGGARVTLQARHAALETPTYRVHVPPGLAASTNPPTQQFKDHPHVVFDVEGFSSRLLRSASTHCRLFSTRRRHLPPPRKSIRRFCSTRGWPPTCSR